MGKEFFNKLIFYFENAPSITHNKTDETLLNKVKDFLNRQKPERMWKNRGILNKRLKKNVYIDFIIILGGKVIACKVGKSNFAAKFDLFNGVKMFDALWFFTDIRIEKKHLHYKLENKLKIPQKFFGLNKKGEIAEIKTH